ncbi:putative carboxypeptidase C [Helianthus annuus]|nr:putative carboxypeptidase C [Helianthus annuus]
MCPFNFEKTGGMPKLHLNPYTWTKVSNMIYLDSPAGVGMSYSANKTDYITRDTKTASDSHKFLLEVFLKNRNIQRKHIKIPKCDLMHTISNLFKNSKSINILTFMVAKVARRSLVSRPGSWEYSWFKIYPEYLSNPFFIAGESYAGVYVPTLSYEVVKGLDAGDKPTLNFKGYIVGNGVTDDVFDGNALVPFAHGMGLISDELYQVHFDF